MRIKNKIESINAIKELGLNRFPEDLFKVSEVARIVEYLEKTKAPLYAIRDKSHAQGLFLLAVPYDEVLNSIKDYEIFSINVSSLNYVDNQILVGEIEVKSNNELYLTVTTKNDASVRDAVREPIYNLKTDIFDKRLRHIPGFSEIYCYIMEHKLMDLIVEFAVFDKGVGIYNENVIIYELRTDY